LRTELKSNAALGELLQTAGSNMVLLKTKPLLQHLVLTMLGLVLIEVLLVVLVIKRRLSLYLLVLPLVS
jgi:hypothetical protein